MFASEFGHIAKEMAAGMASAPVTLLEFEDVRSALFLSGQIEMGEHLAERNLSLIRLLGVLGRRYDGQNDFGLRGSDLWDHLCRDRHAWLQRFPQDAEVSALVALHQEMSDFCESVRLHALHGARNFKELTSSAASSVASAAKGESLRAEASHSTH